jgi:NAD+ synthase (glutamine-hydrolysing)
MTQVRLAAAILNQTPLDWSGNHDRIVTAVRSARDQGAAVLCLPELCITGYGCEDMFLSPHVWAMAWDSMQRLLPETRGMMVTVGLPLYVTNGVYNVAAVLADGRIAGFAPKQHLAGDGLHYEPRWFRAWPAETISRFCHNEQEWPIGELIFECDGIRFGFEVCEDAWVAVRPGSRMAECGVDVILNPSASHFAFGKHAIRHRFVLEAARAFGVSYVYSNLIGNEAGRAIYDGGALIASAGELIATGPRFGFHEVHVTTASVDVALSRSRRASVHSMPTDVSQSVFDRVVSIPGTLSTGSASTVMTPVEPASLPQEEEFTAAIALALFDYLRKSHSGGFVVSMSGGADSSAVACLVRCMVDRSLAELGWQAFRDRLAAVRDLPAAGGAADAMRVLLTGVYQATRNSSETTRAAAEAVTKAVNGTFHEWNVDDIVERYQDVVQQAIGRPLTWEQDDVTLQNIQARTRSPGAWMLANLRGALLLSTSNRSEAAVGYATMDGDTSGGLSPVAGIDKAFLRSWLRTMETRGCAGTPAIPALQLVNAQQPTAELRPAEAEQTDEGDLMPYPLLDQIEGLAIRDKKGPAEVYEALQAAGSKWPDAQLKAWIVRFFRLWSRNQWKRERYAPTFHVDDKNLDPKTWCRFPILSGGFEAELQQLLQAD